MTDHLNCHFESIARNLSPTQSPLCSKLNHYPKRKVGHFSLDARLLSDLFYAQLILPGSSMKLFVDSLFLLPFRCRTKVRLLPLATLALCACASLVRAQVGNPELVAQAKKEGALMWYTTISIPE